MPKFKTSLEQFKNAVGQLRKVLQQEKNEYMRDSAIQRFEFTFDLAWKTTKEFLEESGVICVSPKECFKDAYKNGLVEYDDFWVEMVIIRNKTAHIYKEEMAEETYIQLPKILGYFEKLLNALEK